MCPRPLGVLGFLVRFHHGQQGSDRDAGLPRGDVDFLEDARGRRLDFDRRLVGLDFEKDIALGNLVAGGR